VRKTQNESAGLLNGPAPKGPSRVKASAKRDTLARLIQAARAEFATKGVALAKVDSIARAAGVTKQLVYHYYESKEDLFAAVLDDASARTMPKLVAMSFDHLAPAEALRALLREVFDQYRSDPLLGPLARESMRFHEEHPVPQPFLDLIPILTEKFRAILQRGIDAGEFRSDADAPVNLAAAVLMITGGFTNRSSLSAILGFDTASDDGMEIWRRIANDIVLNALRPNIAS
jgi:AcrR family transcriptional regulator